MSAWPRVHLCIGALRAALPRNGSALGTELRAADAEAAYCHGELQSVALERGYVGVSNLQFLAKPGALTAYPGYPYGADSSGWDAMGFHWRRDRLTLLHPKDRSLVMVISRTTVFAVWLGLLLALSAILPACWLIRKWVRRRDKQPGTCRVCGYDLRASKERCPECGTAVAA